MIIPKLELEVIFSCMSMLFLYVTVLVHTVLASAKKQQEKCISKCEIAVDPLIRKRTGSCFILMLVI